MTDKELIERLRGGPISSYSGYQALCDEAADRLEALTQLPPDLAGLVAELRAVPQWASGDKPSLSERTATAILALQAQVDAHKARADVAEAAFVESTGELIAANAALAEAMELVNKAAQFIQKAADADFDWHPSMADGEQTPSEQLAAELNAFLARHQAEKGGDAIVQPRTGLETRQVVDQPLSSQSAGGADDHAQASETAGGWRSDMENAPRVHGKHIEMFGNGSGFEQCTFIGAWIERLDGNRTGWTEAFGGRAAYPTHWRPLPPPPPMTGELVGIKIWDDVRTRKSQSAAPAQEDGWLPIESAPRDGTKVLLWFGDPFIAHEVAAWSADAWRDQWDGEVYEDNGGWIVEPSYWQPLPPPPPKPQEGGK